MDYHESANQQQSDAIAEKTDRLGKALNYTLDKQLTIAEKFFPDAITRERANELRRVASQEFKIQADMLLIIRHSQKRILTFHRGEMEKQIEALQKERTFNTRVKTQTRAMEIFLEGTNQISQSLKGYVSQLKEIEDEFLEENMMKTYRLAVDMNYKSLESSLVDFFDRSENDNKFV